MDIPDREMIVWIESWAATAAAAHACCFALLGR